MKFAQLLDAVGNSAVFATQKIAPVVGLGSFRDQLGEWTRTGKLVQLRRGLYVIDKPYRPTPACEVIGNELFAPSYVSLESALSFYGLIPEWVPVTTCVTTGRPCERLSTSLGEFSARHLSPKLFWGFKEVEVGPGQVALMAEPEKALLDLIHLTPRGDFTAYLQELRLQNLERIDIQKVEEMARRSGSPKLLRAARRLGPIVQEEVSGWVVLD